MVVIKLLMNPYKRFVLLIKPSLVYKQRSLGTRCLVFFRNISTQSQDCNQYIETTPSLPPSRQSEDKNNISNKNIALFLQEKVKWANDHYEKLVGLSDTRQIQNEVLKAERMFLETRKEKRVSQDKVDLLKDQIKDLWDKLESTPRSSDRYIELRTKEHNLVREQALLDTNLKRLKDKEQATLDDLSSLLRRSHEQERLRQDRSKMITFLSLAMNVVIIFITRFYTKEGSIEGIKESIIENVSKPLTRSFEGLSQNISVITNNSKMILKEVERGDRLVEKRLTGIERQLKILNGQNLDDQSWWSWLWSWIYPHS